MNCKHCGAELPEGSSVCPACGEVSDAHVTPEIQTADTAQPEKKGPVMVPLRLVLAIAAIVILAAALVTVVILGISGNGPDSTTPNATEAPATVPTDGDPNNETCKGSYTVTDEELQSRLDTIVATMGDIKLDNGMLQMYYWNQVYDFLNYAGSYAAYFGLDYTKPLDTQVNQEAGTTWQQYFLMESLKSWQQFAALADTAQKENVTLSKEMQDSLDNFETNLEEQAKQQGYKDGQAFIASVIGPGVSVEDYKTYLYQNYLGYTYLEKMAEARKITTDDINAYYTEHEKDYKELKESGSKLYNVRHILLFPGGTQKDEYTDEEWAKGLTAAEELLQQWKDGAATEESFAELAKKHSGDSNAAAGGLYEGLSSKTNFVTEFKDWYLDSNRKIGDTGIVKTTYGYHLMYFSGTEEEWISTIRNQISKDYQQSIVDAVLEQHPVEITYGNIVLGYVKIS